MSTTTLSGTSEFRHGALRRLRRANITIMVDAVCAGGLMVAEVRVVGPKGNFKKRAEIELRGLLVEPLKVCLVKPLEVDDMVVSHITPMRVNGRRGLELRVCHVENPRTSSFLGDNPEALARRLRLAGWQVELKLQPAAA